MAYSYKYIFITGKISKYKSALQDITDFCHEPRRAGFFLYQKPKISKNCGKIIVKFLINSLILLSLKKKNLILSVILNNRLQSRNKI